MLSGRKPILEIESRTEPDLALPICAGRNKKYTRGKINEARSEVEHGVVKDITDLDDRAKFHLFAQFPLARDAQIERVKARPFSGVPRQVAAS